MPILSALPVVVKNTFFVPYTRYTQLLSVVLAAGIALTGTGCESCVQKPDGDAGQDDGGINPNDGGNDDGGNTDPDGGDGGNVDAGPQCGEDTLGFGDPCSAVAGDPLCGTFVCNPETNELVCADPGANACQTCGDLDTSAGRLGETCGEFGCGVIDCNPEGTATVCTGDHPRNECGGCATLPEGISPGDTCSSCGTGVELCTRDQNSLVCWQGRSSTNSCGTCDRCVLFHAFMDERFAGGYIRAGTRAMIEDVGDGLIQLVFDPLIEGPGSNGLVLTRILLSTTPDPSVGASISLSPSFSEAINGIGADPVRIYNVPTGTNIELFPYLVLQDIFFNEVISVGTLIVGPPDDVSIDVDAGVIGIDAGVDAGIDAGSANQDAGNLDAGAVDAGNFDAGITETNDAGADGGVDAGANVGNTDAGSSGISDAGVDAGIDAGL